MRRIDLLESEETNNTTPFFLLQTAKENSQEKLYQLPKVRQLTAEEIAQAETQEA